MSCIFLISAINGYVNGEHLKPIINVCVANLPDDVTKVSCVNYVNDTLTGF